MQNCKPLVLVDLVRCVPMKHFHKTKTNLPGRSHLTLGITQPNFLSKTTIHTTPFSLLKQ